MQRLRQAPIRPADILDAAVARLRELVAFIVRPAADDPAQLLMLDRGDTVIYRRDVRLARPRSANRWARARRRAGPGAGGPKATQ